MNKKYLLIFDWDGVIANSGTYFMGIYRKLCHEYNKHFPIDSFEEFRDWYDSRWENNFYRLRFSEYEIPQVVDYFRQIVNYEEVNFFPGVTDMLLRLSEDYNMGVASTTPSCKIRSMLADRSLDGLFSIISGGEGGASEKVSKIKKVIEYFHMPRERCVMIGDTVMDIMSAREVGIRSIGVTFGWNSGDILEKAGPSFIVDSHEELLYVIYKLFPAE